MDLVVDRQHLDLLMDQGFAEILDEADCERAHLLAREIVDYGAEVLPPDLFHGPSGRRIAAMATADVEGVALLDHAGLLDGRERIAALGCAHGFAAVALAARRRDRRVDLVEADDRRAWLLQRMCRVFGLRNLRVHTLDIESWSATARGSIDLLLVQGPTTATSLDEATTWLSPEGLAAIWWPSEDVTRLRRPMTGACGGRIRLDRVEAFESPAAQPGALVCVSCDRGGVAPDDA